jgi:hypothetical protein
MGVVLPGESGPDVLTGPPSARPWPRSAKNSSSPAGRMSSSARAPRSVSKPSRVPRHDPREAALIARSTSRLRAAGWLEPRDRKPTVRSDTEPTIHSDTSRLCVRSGSTFTLANGLADLLVSCERARPAVRIRSGWPCSSSLNSSRRPSGWPSFSTTFGLPAGLVVFAGDRPFAVLGFTIRGGRIAELDIFADPKRLAGSTSRAARLTPRPSDDFALLVQSYGHCSSTRRWAWARSST